MQLFKRLDWWIWWETAILPQWKWKVFCFHCWKKIPKLRDWKQKRTGFCLTFLKHISPPQCSLHTIFTPEMCPEQFSHRNSENRHIWRKKVDLTLKFFQNHCFGWFWVECDYFYTMFCFVLFFCSGTIENRRNKKKAAFIFLFLKHFPKSSFCTLIKSHSDAVISCSYCEIHLVESWLFS